MSLLRRDLAANGAWSRRWVLAAAGLMALSPLAGCSHHRSTSYRPIFARPTSGCSTCGGASMGGTTVTTEPAASVPSSTVTTPSIDSSVTPSSTFRGNSSGTVRSSTVERPPSAQIGPDPEFDAFSSGSSSTRSSAKVPGAGSPPAPASPGMGSGPTLLEPKSDAGSASTMLNDRGASDARLTSRAGAGAGSAADRGARSAEGGDVAAKLQPYIAGSGASELFYPAKADRPWRYIVLHHSASAAGNYDEIDREHRKQLGYDGCGYHFIIGNGNGSGDGQIEVARRWDNQKQGVHCRNARSHDVDEYGIGICLIGDLDQQPPTPRQVAAAQALIAYLSRRYEIVPANISTHAHLAATPTACPGKYFPEALAGARIDGRDAG